MLEQVVLGALSPDNEMLQNALTWLNALRQNPDQYLIGMTTLLRSSQNAGVSMRCIQDCCSTCYAFWHVHVCTAWVREWLTCSSPFLVCRCDSSQP